jgi:hypothetical protein
MAAIEDGDATAGQTSAVRPMICAMFVYQSGSVMATLLPALSLVALICACAELTHKDQR